MMNGLKYLPTIAALIAAVTASAEELVMNIDPSTAVGSDSITIVDGELRIQAVAGQEQQTLLQLSQLGISAPVYALTGRVRYDGISGDGYLQLDNHFGDKGTFFTKSLATSGPLQSLSGSSDWREFVLPFYANQGNATDAPTPDALTLSLYLPGSGTVALRELALYQYAANEDPLGIGGFAIGMNVMIWVGAIGGVLVGLWGALVGYLVPRAKARGFVLGSASLLIVAGFVALAGGVFAVIDGQPYAVYYPLLLLGGILVLVVGGIRMHLPRRYEAVELQKMHAMDA